MVVAILLERIAYRPLRNAPRLVPLITAIGASYFLANTALTRDNIVREIDRYFVWPGQACAYQIGKNKILELRERAKAALGPRFDIHKYHDTVLENGGVPLPVLETIVADWVRASG
jgi:uncharacterized protein (DUF885 family)